MTEKSYKYIIKVSLHFIKKSFFRASFLYCFRNLSGLIIYFHSISYRQKIIKTSGIGSLIKISFLVPCN